MIDQRERVICLDLEGVLVPEIWQAVAREVDDERLLKTTRDIPVYEELMDYRLNILAERSLGLSLIQEVIAGLQPLPGAAEFLAQLRSQHQVAILSDTFYEFAQPLMAQLQYPMLLCHKLVVEEDQIVAYKIRQADPKRQAVKAFRSLNYQTVAAGDSYNDVAMLEEADAGFFFSAPDNVLADYPQYPLAKDYAQLAEFLLG